MMRPKQHDLTRAELRREEARARRRRRPVVSARVDTADYRRAYERGWRTSSTSAGGALDRADARGEPAAWYDGYLDAAAGREKWHRLFCADHERCA